MLNNTMRFEDYRRIMLLAVEAIKLEDAELLRRLKE